MFADALPSDYLVRLWDVFLFDGMSDYLSPSPVVSRTIAGVTFLFRAGLALFSCTRRIVLQSTSPDALLNVLCRPPPSLLPPTPDAFIELAFSMKLKDDDVLKQRQKMDTQLKRATQQTRPTRSGTLSSLMRPSQASLRGKA